MSRPIGHANLTMFPVTDGKPLALSYVLLESALAAKKPRIVELVGGSVAEPVLAKEADGF